MLHLFLEEERRERRNLEPKPQEPPPKTFSERFARSVDVKSVSDPRVLLAAGRRDPQVLGREHAWGAWASQHRTPGRRCQRSSPTELHHRVSRTCTTFISEWYFFNRFVPISVNYNLQIHVSSLLVLLSACRDGDESSFGRPGGWEDGRSRLRGRETCVCSAGKVAQ